MPSNTYCVPLHSGFEIKSDLRNGVNTTDRYEIKGLNRLSIEELESIKEQVDSEIARRESAELREAELAVNMDIATALDKGFGFVIENDRTGLFFIKPGDNVILRAFFACDPTH